MWVRQAKFTLGVLVILAGTTPAAAASIDLHLTISADSTTAGQTLVTGRVTNTGQVPAFDLYAELWQQPQRRRLGDLSPDAHADIVWVIASDAWIRTFRQVAAMRVRYRDGIEHWADAVVATGPTSPAETTPLVWPEPATFRINWTNAPAPTGRIVWWRPFALGVMAPEEWHSDGGALSVTGRVSPGSAIGGWTTTAYALILPAPADRTTPAGSIVQIPVDARARGTLWRPAWPWVAAWIAFSVLAWFGARRTRAALPALTTVAVLGAVALALVPPALILNRTTPAGGDYASHIVGLAYLREHLLPSARAFGWFPGQFAGFPLFLFYFPLAFLAAAALSLAAPLTVAMKVASLLGVALLPIAWWLTLGWLGAPRAARWIGAAASLWLLLGEWQNVWGGNLASTLAGEFAYGLGYALAWVTMAWAWKTKDERDGWRALAVLFALTAMAHGYALVAAVAGALLMTVAVGKGPWRGWRLAWTGAVAFGLAAWWLVPFLWNAPWTVGVRGRWVVSPHELLPRELWIAVAIAGAGLFRAAVRRGARQVESGRIWLAAFAASMIGLYAAGFSLGVVDVRFLPFFQGALILLACWELGRWLSALPERIAPFVTSAVIVAIAASAVPPVTYVPDWVRWNFNGMEQTGLWPFFNSAMDHIKGQLSGPRVVFEHHPDHDAAGTTRAFEMIPWFASRSTLEGLYRESALLAAPVYYIQSELTRTPSCPVEGLECGRFDPAGALPHLGLFAVDTIITYGDATAQALEASDEVVAAAQDGPYERFTIRNPRPLAEPVRFRPVIDESDDWRGDAYDWFRAATDLDVPLVLRRRAREGEPHVARYRPRALPREALTGDPAARAVLNGDRIDLDTAEPGRPLFVKVAFHPGWRADDGSTIDLVAPGMMLVTPRSPHVVLRWSAGWAGTAGLAVSVVALVVLAGVRRVPSVAPRDVPSAVGLAWCAMVVAAVAIGAASAVVRHPPADYGDLLAAGQRAMTRRDFPDADRLFSRVLAADDRHHALRDDAGLYYGLSAEAAGNRGETEVRWRRFLDEFPVSTFRSEVLVRLARLLTAAGRADDARRALAEAADAPLGDAAWRAEARGKLAEAPSR